MRLKYYLRGIGVGIVITTFLFMILLSFNKNNEEQLNTVIGDTESKTVAEYENGESNPADITKPEETPQPNPDVLPDETPQPNPDVLPVEEPQPEEPQQPNSDVLPEETPQPEAPNPADTSEKVRFVISGGEYSDVICRKLKEAGLIDDAEAYNKFLVEEDYDNYINPGVYDIPKNATYEEIAVLLTTKVENP